MKQTLQIMAGLQEHLTLYNHAQAECVETSFTLTEYGVFSVEATFSVKRVGTEEGVVVKLVETVSNIDVRYFSQYSNDFLMKQIFQELLLDLEMQLLENETCH
jgi:hypothetical protein